jgi:hypothetical protein
LTDPEVPIRKVGLEDEVIGWGEDPLGLPQQAGIPKS